MQRQGSGGCRSIDNVGEYERLEVAGERVDSVVQEDVLLMKVDVEGFEPTAFQSSKGILDSFRCPCPLSSLKCRLCAYWPPQLSGLYRTKRTAMAETWCVAWTCAAVLLKDAF